MAQFYEPFLGGDYAMAHKLVSEATNILALCVSEPTTNIGSYRMVITFTGISPFRGDKLWSQSRRPGSGAIVFHLFNGCPTLIVPVVSNAPIIAWSPWTLAQMRDASSSRYTVEKHYEQLHDWLNGIISLDHVLPELRPKYAGLLNRAIYLVIQGAVNLQNANQSVLDHVDTERAGIVAFRY